MSYQEKAAILELGVGHSVSEMPPASATIRQERWGLRSFRSFWGVAVEQPPGPAYISGHLTAQGLSVHCPHTAGFVFLTILKGLYKQEICMPKTSKAHKTSCQLTPGIRERNRSLSVSRLGERQARRKDLKPERTDQIFRKQKRKKYYVWFKTVLRQSANQTI